MTTSHIKKNIALSGEFDTYVARNPQLLKGIPKGAHIILTQKSDPAFSEMNLKTLRNTRVKHLVEARQMNGSWKIFSIS
jgi:hypothetical protein